MIKGRIYRGIKRWEESTFFDKLMFLILTWTLICASIYIFRGANLIFSSDGAAANLLAREQRITGKLLPETWNYSTDLMVWFLNIPSAFLQLFLKNELFIRSISVCIFAALTFTAVRGCCKVLNAGGFSMLICSLLFMGISTVYTNMFLAEAGYIVPIFCTFLGFYLYITSIDVNFSIIRKRNYFFLLLLIFMEGSFSITILQQVVIPLVGATVLLVWFENKNININNIPSIAGITKVLMGIGLISVISLAMYVWIGGISAAGVMLQMRDPNGMINNVSTSIAGFLFLLGVEGNVNILSLYGLKYVLQLVFGVALIIGSILMTTKYNKQDFKVRLFILYSWIHIFEVILILFLGSGSVDIIAAARYWITSMCLMMVLSSLFLYKYIIINVKPLSLTNLIFSVYIGLLVIINTSEKLAFSFIQYDEKYNSKYGVIDFLEKNDLEYGYASFWNAEEFSVASDFAVQIHPVFLEEEIRPFYWLTSNRYFDANNYEGETFLMFTQDEYSGLEVGQGYCIDVLGEPLEILYYNQYVIQVYDYNVCINDFQGINDADIMEKVATSR